MKQTIALISAWTLAWALYAQSMVERAFVAMPDAYYMALNQAGRAMAVEQYHMGDTSGVVNNFGGRTRVTALNTETEWLEARNSDKGKTELKVEHAKDGGMIAVIVFTACAPQCSSHAAVVDSRWRMVRTRVLPEVNVMSFVDRDTMAAMGLDEEQTVARIDIPMITYDYDRESGTLNVTLHSIEAMDEETRKQMEPLIKAKTLHYTFDAEKRRYVPAGKQK